MPENQIRFLFFHPDFLFPHFGQSPYPHLARLSFHIGLGMEICQLAALFDLFEYAHGFVCRPERSLYCTIVRLTT